MCFLSSDEKSSRYSHSGPQHETELTQNWQVRWSEGSGAGDKLCTQHALYGVNWRNSSVNSHRAATTHHVTCMGRVSCHACFRQHCTVQLRFNWSLLRFLHIYLALFHTMFPLPSLLLIFPYPLLPITLVFSSLSINYFLILSFCLFLLLPFYFLLWRFVFCAFFPLIGHHSQKDKKETRKDK